MLAASAILLASFNPRGVQAAADVPAFDHIFVIVMENHSYAEIVGNTAQAPYLNRLASQYGVAINYHGVSHPSLPNYLALTGGDTFGITSDCVTCWVNAPNIATDRVAASGRTWRAYMESMPSNCGVGDAYPYAQRHNPFVYYTGLRTSPVCASGVVPLSALASDLATTTTTANYVWISPNLCDDMHDCSVSAGDAWLSSTLPTILGSPAFVNQSSLVLITWDEDDSSQNNQVATLVIARGIAPGFRSATAYNHYSLLRTIEQAWGLTPLGANDASASPMADFFGAMQTLNSVQDTFIDSSNPASTAGGSASELRSDRWPQQTAFLRFDLSSLAGKTLTSAILRIHTSAETWAGSTVPHTIKYVNDNTWQEQWMSWNNTVSPWSVATTPIGTLLALSSDTWYSAGLDLPTVQAHAGALLSMEIDASQGDVLLFSSRDAGPATAPQLVITAS